MALTVLFVPYSLDNGLRSDRPPSLCVMVQGPGLGNSDVICMGVQGYLAYKKQPPPPRTLQ